MTNNESQQLVEFLGRKFAEVDARFAQVDARLDQIATREELQGQQAETRRHFEVVAEGLRADIRQVAEGHQFLMDGQARIIAGYPLRSSPAMGRRSAGARTGSHDPIL